MDSDREPREPDDALERALVTHIAGMRRYARALVGNATDAEDLVQESLARALARIRPWTSVRDLRSYLFTILHNHYVDQYRSRRNAPAMVDIDNVLQHPSAPANQDRRLELRDLGRALETLSEEQRAVVLLVGLEGLSYAEVAKVLDVPIGTVMSRLSRGRSLLRELIQTNRMPAPVAKRKPT
ncbi:MAG: RNA polymerase sigma factor [Pseudomonadota bacterium]